MKAIILNFFGERIAKIEFERNSEEEDIVRKKLREFSEFETEIVKGVKGLSNMVARIRFKREDEEKVIKKLKENGICVDVRKYGW